MRYIEEANRILISVNELVALARRGISPPVSEEADESSERVAKDREKFIPDELESEITLDTSIGEWSVTISGTADGVSDGVITLLRRVEPRRGLVSREDKEQIRGEAFILGYLSLKCGQMPRAIRTVYVDHYGEVVADEKESPSEKLLTAFFDKCMGVAEKYARPEVDRVTKRLPAFKGVRFPFENIREGQREFIRAVYRTLARGTRLYASAPTGTGKTVSVLYPAIKAMGEGRCDKVFYLTPKHTTAEAARDTLDLFAERGVLVRAVQLYSKESLCTENMSCRISPRACSLTEFKNLPDAVLALYDAEKTVITRSEITAVAKEYRVCPHELALCYSELCDIVICDFNYLYDPQVYLRRYFTRGGKFAFLVDEAHNLPDRAREMYSVELSLDTLDAIAAHPLVGEHSPFAEAVRESREALYELFFPYLKEELREGADGEPVGATHLSELPSECYGLFGALYAAAEDAFRRSTREKDEEAEARTLLLRGFYHECTKLVTVAENFDEKYRLFLFYKGGVLSFKLFCLDTGGVIARRTALGHGAVFFSATLEPIDYYRSLLGADGATDTISVSSPFDPSQLSVSIVDVISTRFSERERTAPAVCRTIAAVMSARRGNYMVFCPSFDYLDLVSRAFISKYPKIATLVQKRDMSAAEKRDFLAKFREENGKYLVGFCVLGGIYSEGVDLAGDSLIGAVVVGIGMPQLSYEREAMRDYFMDKYEAGTEYAYLYPGMNKVFQAAGRVIRREDDRGVIVLIDDRFRDPIYKKSIPALWHGMRYVSDAKELKERIELFWQKVDGERE